MCYMQPSTKFPFLAFKLVLFAFHVLLHISRVTRAVMLAETNLESALGSSTLLLFHAFKNFCVLSVQSQTIANAGEIKKLEN